MCRGRNQCGLTKDKAMHLAQVMVVGVGLSEIRMMSIDYYVSIATMIFA